MDNSMFGLMNPFLINTPKTKEEKLEEWKKTNKGFNEQQEVLCCKKCGSRDVQILGYPTTLDYERGAELYYICRSCGYEGYRIVKIKTITEDGTLVVDLVPDGLIGVTSSLI